MSEKEKIYIDDNKLSIGFDIVSFVADDDHITVTEECDGYFSETFDFDEFQNLINELQTLLSKARQKLKEKLDA